MATTATTNKTAEQIEDEVLQLIPMVSNAAELENVFADIRLVVPEDAQGNRRLLSKIILRYFMNKPDIFTF